jgi:hypothetical protein
MNFRRLGIWIWGLSAGLAVAWYIESLTCGRCFISKYVPPLALVGLFWAMCLMHKPPEQNQAGRSIIMWSWEHLFQP